MIPPADLEIRPFGDEDLAPSVGLLQDTFGAWPSVQTAATPLEHLQWKLSSAAGRGGFQLIAISKGRQIATRFYLFHELKLQGRIVTACQTVDLCIDARHQNTGVYSAMRRFRHGEFRRAFGVRFGFTDHPAVLSLDKRAGGGQMVNRIAVLACRPERQTENPPRAGWDICAPARFDPRIDSFSDRSAAPFQFMIRRSCVSLNWRYCDRRAGNFLIKTAERSNEILGYVTYRLGSERAFIADLLALPGRLDVADALLRDALRCAHDAGSQSVEYWLPISHPYNELAFDAGFVSQPRRVSLSYAPLGADPSELAFLRDPQTRVHVSLGDSDLV